MSCEGPQVMHGFVRGDSLKKKKTTSAKVTTERRNFFLRAILNALFRHPNLATIKALIQLQN